LEYGRTNLGFTRDWKIWIRRSAKADLGAPAQKMRGAEHCSSRADLRSTRDAIALALLAAVMRGLDPRIHDEVQQMSALRKAFLFRTPSWIAPELGLVRVPYY
jgi:hypothetical protein